jgi:hypothetical protein
MEHRKSIAAAYGGADALLRLRELEALRDLAKNARARIYIGFPKHSRPPSSSKS